MERTDRLLRWVEALPERGRYSFSKEEALAATCASADAVKMTLYRLKKRGKIVAPRRDFFVVVPPEYRTAGSPPASWFIDDLMRHRGRRYYVGLLSAAALHGAGHQQPMALQVIADAGERPVEVGRVRVEFHVSRRVVGAETERMRTETGTMVVSTPETTAVDFVRFPAASGHWSHVATTLAELAESMHPERLVAALPRASRSEVQRLGWLLDVVEQHALSDSLVGYLDDQPLQPVPLTSRRGHRDAPLNARWLVLENDHVEADL